MTVASSSVISAVRNGKSASIKSDESRLGFTRDAKHDKEVLAEVSPFDSSTDRQFLGKLSGPRCAWSEGILTQDLLHDFISFGKHWPRFLALGKLHLTVRARCTWLGLFL